MQPDPKNPKNIMVDVRPFKRDFVENDFVPLFGIREGFRYDFWYREKIPPEVIEALKKAYPEPARQTPQGS